MRYLKFIIDQEDNFPEFHAYYFAYISTKYLLSHPKKENEIYLLISKNYEITSFPKDESFSQIYFKDLEEIKKLIRIQYKVNLLNIIDILYL